ncbi:MAG TPA: glycosyltransferase, partial [Sedimenticola sp.]|nr:glycosyltransferase [Sedimenticola sp.]
MNSVIDSEKPLISVVMPCYNEAERIGEAVASVFRQTFRSLELIVVDDGSSDNSLQVLYGLQAKHGRLQVFSQPNRGAGPARNMGLQHARGEYIAFLDADDAWHPACLEKLHARLAATPDAALVYCGWQNIGLPADQGRPFIPPEYEGPDKVETLLRGCRWPIHAALTRREAITRSGGFDEQWSSCMDYDLWLRIAAFERIVRLPEVLAYYHHHGGEQITKNRLR